MESALDVLSKAAHFVENQEKQNEATDDSSNKSNSRDGHSSPSTEQLPLDCSKVAVKSSSSENADTKAAHLAGMLLKFCTK